jgi:hypothetical protein
MRSVTDESCSFVCDMDDILTSTARLNNVRVMHRSMIELRLFVTMSVTRYVSNVLCALDIFTRGHARFKTVALPPSVSPNFIADTPHC